MSDFDTDNSAFSASGFNTGMDCDCEMPVDVDSQSGGAPGIFFGRTGDASFDDLMDRF